MSTQALVKTFSYRINHGWSVETFPALDSEQTLLIVFGDTAFIDASEALQDLIKAYPQAHIIGCSTAGEILGNTLSEQSLSVGVLRFAHTQLRSAFAPVANAAESYQTGKTLAEQLNAPDLRGIFILSDGLNVNGSELVKGLNKSLSSAVVVTGGLAGDGARFERTWVLHQGKAQSAGVSAVGFYGDRIQLGHGSNGGWDIFGIERLVTRASGNILYELDHQPALELYKTYLGELADGLPATALLFPLGLRNHTEDNNIVVRTILAIDEKAQSMTFAGDIPQGSLVRLMKASAERLIDGASQAGRMAQFGPEAPLLNIAISCVGRRLVLGQRSEEELEASLENFPLDAPQIGFYSYGEISPHGQGFCDLHNQTMTITSIYEP